MKLRKYAMFAIALGTLTVVLGLSWVIFGRNDLWHDDNVVGVLMMVAGITLVVYTMRTLSFLKRKVYENTQSIDNDLLFSSEGDFTVKGIGAFNFGLAVISAFSLIGLTVMAVAFWGWFLERPNLNRVNRVEEVIGMLMALVVTICVVPSFIYLIRTYDKKYVFEDR
jgi:hypothetical protein